MLTTHPLHRLSFHWVTLCPGCLTEFRCSSSNPRVTPLISTLSQDSFSVDLLWGKRKGNVKKNMYYWNLNDLVPLTASLQRWSSMSHDFQDSYVCPVPSHVESGWVFCETESWENLQLCCLGIFSIRTLPLESRCHSVESPGHMERRCTSSLANSCSWAVVWFGTREWIIWMWWAHLNLQMAIVSMVDFLLQPHVSLQEKSTL